jgi:hypothetical protein
MGQFVKGAAVQADRAAAAELRVAAARAGGRDFVTKADEQVHRQFFHGFEKYFDFQRLEIMAEIFHGDGPEAYFGRDDFEVIAVCLRRTSSFHTMTYHNCERLGNSLKPVFGFRF